MESKVKYWRGVGAEESGLASLGDGLIGAGCEDLIRDIYKQCMGNTADENDEVYFFGFSRGAYIVGAVAGLLHHLGRISRSDGRSFEQNYASGLKQYREIINPSSPPLNGSVNYFFARQPGKAPKVRFVGWFDCVKATPFDDIHQHRSIKSVQHLRHALALNERRVPFTPKRWLTDDSSWQDSEFSRRSYQEAWFLGSHSDIGGAREKDGLTLYPLQWILSEAVHFGLELHHDDPKPPLNNIEATTKLVFLKTSHEGLGDFPEKIRLANGIIVPLWDMFCYHIQARYAVMFDRRGLSASFMGSETRKVLNGDSVIGYNNNGQFSYGCVISKLASHNSYTPEMQTPRA